MLPSRRVVAQVAAEGSNAGWAMVFFLRLLIATLESSCRASGVGPSLTPLRWPGCPRAIQPLGGTFFCSQALPPAGDRFRQGWVAINRPHQGSFKRRWTGAALARSKALKSGCYGSAPTPLPDIAPILFATIPRPLLIAVVGGGFVHQVWLAVIDLACDRGCPFSCWRWLR